MIPVILYGGTVEERAGEITAKYPTTKYTVTHIVAEKTSILISQIHDLVKQLSVTSSRPRVVWIEEADKLTVPAQNALLKLLEEPPSNTRLLLTAGNPHSLLATIRSRCQVVTLSTQEVFPDSDLTLLREALSLSPGDRILAADSLGRKRELLLDWTETCLKTLDGKIKVERSPKSLPILTQIASLLHTSYLDLQANVSVPLVMQNLFLRLPHVKR